MAKITLKEDLSCLRRAVKIWRGYAPKYWSFATAQRVLQRVSAYFSLTMSALLLDEISGGKDRDRLILFACLTVFGGFLFSVTTRLLRMKASVLDSQSYYRYEQIIFDENCRLQFEHLENPDVRLLSEKIDANTRTVYGGLMSALYIVPNMVDALTELILSLSLTAAALFAGSSGQFSGLLGFVNSPLSACLMLLVIGGFSALTGKLQGTRRSRENDARSEVSLGSRRYEAYGRLWGPDMTIFGLHPIVNALQKKFVHQKWQHALCCLGKAVWFDLAMWLCWTLVFVPLLGADQLTWYPYIEEYFYYILFLGGTLLFVPYDYLIFLCQRSVGAMVRRIRR